MSALLTDRCLILAGSVNRQKEPTGLQRLNNGSRFLSHTNINLVNGVVKSSKA